MQETLRKELRFHEALMELRLREALVEELHLREALRRELRSREALEGELRLRGANRVAAMSQKLVIEQRQFAEVLRIHLTGASSI